MWAHGIVVPPPSTNIRTGPLGGGRFALEPDAVAYFNRGIAYQAKGERDRAIADYDKAIALNPKYANAYYNRRRAP